MQPFTLLIKPAGPDCNLNCTYCFYKGKAIEDSTATHRMSDEVLQKLIKDYMQLGFSPAAFIWQGGEPTLMGLDFYEKVVELQKKYGSDSQEVANCLQTNAILLDDNWYRFLHENNFLVGMSIDGPKEFHDFYRLDHAGCGSFDKAMRAINKCKEHKVEFNVLTLLNNKNIEHPDRLFDFFVENDIEYLQFIPCVETNPATGEIEDFSITPWQYGEFLCRLFDRWCDYGPEDLRIRDFDSILSYCLTGKHTICTFAKQCSQYIVIEHNGDVFCCDFFVAGEWRLGKIIETPIEQLAVGSKKQAFARAKLKIDDKCLLCRHLAVCRGGCLKDRAAGWALAHQSGSGGASPTLPKIIKYRESSIEHRVSCFCEAYKRFFDYAMPRLLQIAAELKGRIEIRT